MPTGYPVQPLDLQERGPPGEITPPRLWEFRFDFVTGWTAWQHRVLAEIERYDPRFRRDATAYTAWTEDPAKRIWAFIRLYAPAGRRPLTTKGAQVALNRIWANSRR